MSAQVRIAVWLPFLLVMVGCGAPTQTLPMAVTTQTVAAPTKLANEPVRVAVLTFEDARPDKTAIGRWQHYIESHVDRIVPLEGTAADQISGFVANYLRLAGFQVTRVQSKDLVSPGSADVVLSGQIETYWSEAVAKLARTEMTSKNRLTMKMSNVADGSGVNAAVEGEQSASIVAFDISDLEKLNSNALAQSMARFLADLKVAGGTVKTKRGQL